MYFLLASYYTQWAKDKSTEYLHFRDRITKRIRSAQYEASKAVNQKMISLYREIGKRITEQQIALGWGKSVTNDKVLNHSVSKVSRLSNQADCSSVTASSVADVI